MAKRKTIFSATLLVLVIAFTVWLVGQSKPWPMLLFPPPPSVTPTPPAALPFPFETAEPRITPSARVATGPFANQQAPAFSLKTLSGETLTLESLRGKVVLLNFWASWCVPCKTEMPAIQKAYEQHHEDGLVVVGINMTNLDNRADIDRFLQETRVNFPILLDESGSVSDLYRVISIPSSFWIDREGVIRSFTVGAMKAEEIQKNLDQLLK